MCLTPRDGAKLPGTSREKQTNLGFSGKRRCCFCTFRPPHTCASARGGTAAELRWLHPTLVTCLTLWCTGRPVSLAPWSGAAGSVHAGSDSHTRSQLSGQRCVLTVVLMLLDKDEHRLGIVKKAWAFSRFHTPNAPTPSLGCAVRQENNLRLQIGAPATFLFLL